MDPPHPNRFWRVQRGMVKAPWQEIPQGRGPGTSQNVIAIYRCVFAEHKCVFPIDKCVFAKHIMVLFLMIFGRTELIISVSKAKFGEEADFEVHWPPNPLNPDKKRKKLFFRTENFFWCFSAVFARFLWI